MATNLDINYSKRHGMPTRRERWSETPIAHIKEPAAPFVTLQRVDTLLELERYRSSARFWLTMSMLLMVLSTCLLWVALVTR